MFITVSERSTWDRYFRWRGREEGRWRPESFPNRFPNVSYGRDNAPPLGPLGHQERRKIWLDSAEERGFEPLDAFTSAVFKTAAFDNSATPPRARRLFATSKRACQSPSNTTLSGLLVPHDTQRRTQTCSRLPHYIRWTNVSDAQTPGNLFRYIVARVPKHCQTIAQIAQIAQRKIVQFRQIAQHVRHKPSRMHLIGPLNHDVAWTIGRDEH